jgi:hypothetical protein
MSMRGRRVVQAIGSRFESVSRFLVIALSMAVIVADANRRVPPELRLDTFEAQAAALWSIDQPLPDMPSSRLVAHALQGRPLLP